MNMAIMLGSTPKKKKSIQNCLNENVLARLKIVAQLGIHT